MSLPRDIMLKIANEYCYKLDLVKVSKEFNIRYKYCIHHNRLMRDVKYTLPIVYLSRYGWTRGLYRSLMHEHFIMMKMECLEHCAAIHQWCKKRNPVEHEELLIYKLTYISCNIRTPDAVRNIIKEYIISNNMVLSKDKFQELKIRWSDYVRTPRSYLRYKFVLADECSLIIS